MNDPIQELKRLLSPEDLPVVVSALRFDPLVWKLINDPEHFRRAAEAAGSGPDGWSPASLALIALEQDLTAETLRGLPLQALSSDLRQQAVQAYEDMLRNPQPPADLKQAGLLALALRERRRLTDSWQGLLAELQGTSASGALLPLDYWNTPLACLYGMSPDPVYLFSALVSTGSRSDHTADASLIVHALLSNPVRPWEQVRILTALLSAEQPDVLMAFLAALKDQAAPEVVNQLSSILTRSKAVADLTNRAGAKSAKNGSAPVDPLTRVEPLQQIADRQSLARFFLESNRSEDVFPLLDAAKVTLRTLQADIALLEAKAAARQNQLETAVHSIQQAIDLVPSSTKARLDLAETYLQMGRYNEASAALPAETGDPRAFLARSLIASAAEKIPQARDYAQTAAKNAASLPKDARFQLTEQLVKLGLFAEAEQAAGAATEQFPADYRFYNLLTRAHAGARHIPAAVQTAQLVTSLAPGDPSTHRLAADAYEAAQDWIRCLDERRSVISLSKTPRVADYHSLAASALQAGDPGETIQVCEQVLKVNPEDGLAHTYLGEAALVNRDMQMALDEFSQATLLLPDDSQAWLGLSKAYDAAGEHQKSIDTLRSASQAAPHNPEILLALGQACLADGSPTEALPALRRAAAIAPHSPELSLQLGNTLYELGRLSEAKQVLERSRTYWPNHPGLALVAGKTQLGLGEIAAALQALEIALRDDPQDPEPYMLYAQSILDLSRSDDQIGSAAKNLTAVDVRLARKSLSTALTLDPQNFEARVLMGEAQAAEGNLQEALDTYLELSEMDQARDPRWNARIHLGMGRVALSLGQMDTAIAALQEAVQADPENLEINQVLAEAYQSAKLSEEATVQARTALGMAPNKVENLLWFANISLKMKDELEAIQTLQHALDVAPERADLRLTLARLQMQLKDEPSARKTLKDVFEIEQTTPEEMSQAAELFSALGDQKSAIVCLQKAIYANPQPAAELWAKLASLQCETGDVDAALEAVQTALEIRPFDAGLHYLHGDLLTSQNKKQAALSCFEQSLDLLEKNPGSAWVYQAEDLLPEPLNLRIAGLLRGLGDLRTALTRAQNVVAANPKSVEGRILAADLAAGLLENPLALELASISQAKGADPDASDQISAIDIDRPSLVKLLCLQAEMHMENADDLNAADALVHASDLAPENPRVLADQARLDARKGDFLDGMEALEAALAYLHADQPADDPTLAIAEAALELHQWQTALPLYAQVVRVAPDEARPHFCLARAYVRAKEYQPAYHSLGALRHTASLAQDPEGDFLAFEREIQSAESLSTSPEINRWYQRGITAFKGGRAEAEAKAIFGADDEVGGEPQSEPTLEGESAPKRMPEQLDRLFQHGLIQKDAAPEMAMATAQALVSQKPGHPLYEALFASVARKNHDPALAYSAIQSALNTWQDEPLWHVFAAETAEECSAPSEALEHWKAACALEPENASFTCSLGEAYLKAGNAEKAVQTLEQAATMDPSEPSAWVSLAHAYRVRRNYPEAIGAAEKAIRLAPGDVLPLAVSGNIALEAKQFELGRQRAQEILAIDENNPKAVLLLAKAEAHQGRPAQALEVIENALPTMAEPFEVLLERGKLIHKLHGAGPALEAFHSLAQRYPDQPEALAEYAMALAEAGQKDAAEHTAQSALQIKPEQADLHLLLGRIQHTAGQLDQAVFHLSEAVHLAPENVETYLELGKTYADRREHSQALQVYQQAFAIAPDDYRPYYQAGLSLKESKDYVMAETMLRRAAELAPDDLNVRRQLAAIIAINLVHNPQEAPTIK